MQALLNINIVTVLFPVCICNYTAMQVDLLLLAGDFYHLKFMERSIGHADGTGTEFQHYILRWQ